MPTGKRPGDAVAAIPAVADEPKDERREKAERLDNWQPLDVHRWSEYPEVNQAVDALYAEFRELPKFRGKQNLGKKHIKVIVLDLYAKWLSDPERYVGYYRMKSAYRANRYNKLHISYITVSIVDALKELGYVEHRMGHYGREGGSSHMSRMRATEKLISLIVERHHVEPEMIETHADRECIELRDQDKVAIEYEDTDETNRMRQELQAYNALLKRTSITLSEEATAADLRVDMTAKFVRRIFNNGRWDHGGRFYGGWWQTIPSEWRAHVLINGERAAELDYSGLHIVILYALEGINFLREIGTDPYVLEGYEKSPRMRTLLKLVLLAAINADTLGKAISGVRFEINKNKTDYKWVYESEINLQTIIESFASHHDPIRKYFFSGKGVELQYIDSVMAERVIKYMTDKNTPILCVHDSFLVDRLEFGHLYESMAQKFDNVLHELTGIDIDVSVLIKGKGRDAELIDSVLGPDHNYALGLKSEDFLSEEELKETPLENW